MVNNIYNLSLKNFFQDLQHFFMKILVKVQPFSKTCEIISDEIDLLNARIITAKINQPPVDGKANDKLIEVLANYFKIKKSAIKIVRGTPSRNKIIEIQD